MGYHFKIKFKKYNQDAVYWCYNRWPGAKRKTWTEWYKWTYYNNEGHNFRFSRKSDFTEFSLIWVNSESEE